MGFLINQSGTAIEILRGGVALTGDLFSFLLIVMAFLFLICIAFRIPLEFSALIILPLLLTFWSYSPSLAPVGGILLIYLAAILTYNWFLK